MRRTSVWQRDSIRTSKSEVGTEYEVNHEASEQEERSCRLLSVKGNPRRNDHLASRGHLAIKHAPKYQHFMSRLLFIFVICRRR
jgi:hypothetical protein